MGAAEMPVNDDLGVSETPRFQVLGCLTSFDLLEPPVLISEVGMALVTVSPSRMIEGILLK